MAVLYCNSVRPFFFIRGAFFQNLAIRYTWPDWPRSTFTHWIRETGWVHDIYQSATDYVYPQKICVSVHINVLNKNRIWATYQHLINNIRQNTSSVLCIEISISTLILHNWFLHVTFSVLTAETHCLTKYSNPLILHWYYLLFIMLERSSLGNYDFYWLTSQMKTDVRFIRGAFLAQRHAAVIYVSFTISCVPTYAEQRSA